MPSGSSAVSAAPISRAEQHGAGGLDGDLARSAAASDAGRGQRPPGADDRGLGLQQVLRGLDQDGVRRRRRACPRTCVCVGVAQRGERRRGRGSAAWCPGPTEPITQRGWSVGAALVGDLAGDAAHPPRRARRSGSRCRTRRGCRGWRRTCWSRRRRRRRRSRPRGPTAHDVGPGHVEDLVAALVALEVVEAEGPGPAASCPSRRRRRRRARRALDGEPRREFDTPAEARHRGRVYGRPDDVR